MKSKGEKRTILIIIYKFVNRMEEQRCCVITLIAHVLIQLAKLGEKKHIGNVPMLIRVISQYDVFVS